MRRLFLLLLVIVFLRAHVALALGVQGFPANPVFQSAQVVGNITLKSGGAGQIVFPDGSTMNTASLGSASSLSNAGNVNVTADSGAGGTGDIIFKTGTNDWFHINNAGTIKMATFSSPGGPLYTDNTGLVKQTTAGTSTQLYHGGANPSFGSLDLSADSVINTLADARLSSNVPLKTNNLSVFAATTSAQLLGVISDETGTGALVFANTPTLVTPVLGVATATSINKMAITAPATSSTLAVADGKTATFNNTLTFTGTDTSSVAFGAGGTVAYVANNLSVFAATTSAQLLGVVSDETGTGALVFANTPTLVTPVLGVATATSVNKVAITAPATSATLTIANGKTLTVSNTLTFTGTDSSSVAFGAGGTVALLGATNAFTGVNSVQDGSKFALQNQADTTKQAQFDVSGITTGATRTVTVPDSNAGLVAVGNALTLAGTADTKTAWIITGTDGTCSGATGPYAVLCHYTGSQWEIVSVLPTPTLAQVCAAGCTYSGAVDASTAFQIQGSNGYGLRIYASLTTGTKIEVFPQQNWLWSIAQGFCWYEEDHAGGLLWKLCDDKTMAFDSGLTGTFPTGLKASNIAVGSDAQGDVYYRGASGLARLAAGTAGKALTTQGASANPTFAWPPTVFVGGTQSTSTAQQNFSLTGTIAIGNGESVVQLTLAAGTYDHLWCGISNGTAPGASKTWTYTLRDNSGNTTATCPVTGASAFFCADDTHSVTLADNHDVNFQVVPTSAPATAQHSCHVQYRRS